MRFRTYYWPILTSIWLAGTFVISYIIAVSDGHVYAFFPFISDTGAKPPESCIFGQLLNFGALFMAITVFLRYKYVKSVQYKVNNSLVTWNKWSNLFGYLACLGISLVANFQEISVGTVHFIGAFMAFGVGTIYFFIQTYISWLSDTNRSLKYLRILLSVLIAPIFICTMTSSSIAFQQFDGDLEDAFHWDSNDKGYDIRLTSTICEWCQAILMCFYILSYSFELKQIEFVKIVFESTDY